MRVKDVTEECCRLRRHALGANGHLHRPGASECIRSRKRTTIACKAARTAARERGADSEVLVEVHAGPSIT
jgi:hypothetical protein